MTPPYHVLIATDLTESSLDMLRSSDDIAVQQIPPTAKALREALPAAHAVICREDVLLDADALRLAPHLRVIARAGTALNGIDIDAATERGIVVMHAPGVSAVAVAELTLTLMLALSRKVVAAHTSVKDGFWLLDRKRQMGTQLQGKTLGLIGYGRVGRAVAARALAFGLDVLAYDPYISEERADDARVALVSLRELLARSDYVSLHVPATGETHHLVDAAFLSAVKPGARLINTSYGGALDEAAVAEALKDGRLAGVALDVYAEEPPYNSPLIGLEHVLHTPHIGDNTHEAAQDLSRQIVAQVLDALRGDDFRNVVNLPFMPGMEFETAAPYMRLAEKIGRLIHTLARQPVARVAVEYRGEELRAIVKPVTVALLRGILAPVLGDQVNYINAPVLAAERKIAVTQAKGLRAGDYASSVNIQVLLEDGEAITVAGTLLDRREPHIVQINDYRMNFIPEGHLLIMGSFDQPGVIGRIGTLLADSHINIASWQTGRATPGGHTLTVLTLDEPLPDALMDTLRGIEFVRHAHQVAL